MDKARRKEEIYNRDKGEALFVEAQELVYEALSLYHKDWPTATNNLQLAVAKLKKTKTHFIKAGLDTARLKEMTPGARRVHARDIMDILNDEELSFLSEPKLPEVCVTDYLDRSAPLSELLFRIESELEKAKARAEGDAKVESAQRAIEQGAKDQRVGLFASARKNFTSAETFIEQAQASFATISTPPQDLVARWTEACNQEDKNPMLTRLKQMELEQALRAREKPHLWAPRNWTVEQGIDMPTMYCLCTMEVGVSLAEINAQFRFEHCEDGLHHDGRDTAGITSRLREALERALREQEEDMEFKAYALCVVPELYSARESVLREAELDRAAAEEKADIHKAKPIDLMPQLHIVWDDLPPEQLGPIAISDEVLELHESAAAGNAERVRWLLEECEKQHYMAVNDRHLAYKTWFLGKINPDALDNDNKTPLFKCARYNQVMTGKLLISQRADLAARDLNGDTPLHMAAANGSSEMVKLLLDHSARPTAPNKDGETALHMCARYALGNMDVARSLVASGADLNIVDARNQTLLHHLVVNRRFGNKELYFLHFFLTMGLDADARDNQGRTALDLCEDPEARNMLRKAYKDQVQLRLDRWGETGLPPVLVNAPKGLQEQQMEITLGVPLLCVLHKGQHAVANREACRACSVGLVVTVPYRGTTDYCHMCANCGVKDVTNHWVRDANGFV